MIRVRQLLLSATLAAAFIYGSPVSAQTIIDEWSSVKVPPAPELKAVTLDPKTTALLVMDLIKQLCNEKNRPRCIASIPKVEKLLAEARAKGVTVIYTIIPSPAPSFPAPVIGDTLPAIAPKGNEPVVVAFVDKFNLKGQETGLDKMLKDKGITTIIAVGTAAHGAGLYTPSVASLRGYNVVVPVDGVSGDGDNTYIEQAVAYILTHAPIVSPKITLSRTDMIKFAN